MIPEDKPNNYSNFKSTDKKDANPLPSSDKKNEHKTSQSRGQKKSHSNKKQRNYRYGKNKRYSEKNKEPVVYEICPSCSKEIKEPLTSLLEKESMKNAHFECILSQIAKIYQLNGREKIYYIGNGAFGIIEEKRFKNKIKINIRERIQYIEKLDKKKHKENQSAPQTSP